MFAFVGSRTTRERNARGDGLTVFRVDPESGALATVQVFGDLVNPSYLALNASGTRLYAVHGDLDYVSAFEVNPQSGQIRFINRQSTQGNNPVHLALDPTGGYLVVSNHLGGTLAVLPIGANGELRPLTQLVRLEGPIGPHRVEQTQAKPHFNGFDPTGRFVIVPDKGLDRVFTFRFADGKLAPGSKPFAATREDAGPRHHIFHPRQSITYVANELDSTVTAYRFDKETGSLEAFQRVSTLPDSFTGNSRAAGIMIDPQGRTLYASNRGHDSISVFAIDPDSGAIRLTQAVSTEGSKPRFFALTPNGRHLYALNEDSHTVVPFAIDGATGGLERGGAITPCGSPVCMIFSHAA
jgi:6-phosphogluconolactonase (cycloisomerase 2 family)